MKLNDTEALHIFESDTKNDIIDIYSPPDLKVKDMSSKTKFYDRFHIQMEGNSIDNSVSNAIRHVILKLIPIYSFHRKNIHIDNDRTYCMYNNDMIYNQIETLPIFDIPNYFDLENPDMFLPESLSRDLFGTFGASQHGGGIDEESDGKKQLFRIEMTLSVENKSDQYLYVSTHDAILRIDGKIVNSYKNNPKIDLLVLKPGEIISLRAEANLGIAKYNAIYDATTSVVSKEITSRKYEIYYDNIGQLDKHVICKKACVIIKKKLKNLLKYLKNTYPDDLDPSKYVEIQLYGEDYCLGNLLGTILQKNVAVVEAGFSKMHPLDEIVTIKFMIASKSKKMPINILCDSISYLINLYNEIDMQISPNKKSSK